MFKRLIFFLFPLLLTAEGEISSVQEFYSYITYAFQNQKWEEVKENCDVLLGYYCSTPFAKDACYYQGVAYYYLEDYETANEKLSDYLKDTNIPKFLQEAMYYKYLIAEAFRNGGKKHLLPWQWAPKWLSAREDAAAIYEEIISTMPYHDLGAKALFGKAKIQAYFDDFRPAVETLQLLIRRFPTHELAIESFIEINQIYLTQCQVKSLDPSLLDLAEINLRKFHEAFPGEERWEEAKRALYEMEEVFAGGLLETGEFYRRTKKKKAAEIYFSKVISKFPESKAAESAKRYLGS